MTFPPRSRLRGAYCAACVFALTHVVAEGEVHGQVLPTDATRVVTRIGVYGDNDRTRVIRWLIGASTPLPKGFLLGASVGIDAISSASIDVRAAPDAVTRASPTIKPRMVDQRNQYDLSLGWTNGQGAFAQLGGTVANEVDYFTFGASLRGSYDLNERNTTLLGGVVVGRDTIKSVVDPEFIRHLTTVGYSLGLGQVLGQRTAIRIRYDGGYLFGYMASPYRAVRYGNWTALPRPGGDSLVFINTLAFGEERLPSSRIRNAGTVELVQSLAEEIALCPQVTIGHDTWGLTSEAVALELRVGRPHGWRFIGAYRFYYQGGVDFYQEKYTGTPSQYQYATADKKLGKVMSNSGMVQVGYLILERPRRRLALAIDLKAELLYYRYLDFLLLDSKLGTYTELGLRVDF